MKTCNKCQTDKLEAEFYKKNSAKDGLFWWCKVCHKEYVKSKYAQAYANPTFKAHEQIRVKQFYVANPDKKKASDKQYAANNKSKISANVRKYQYAKLDRTPNWLDVDDIWMMEQAYELAELRTKMFGFKWHVDHIIPLQGRLVSGLHVPHNLQILPAAENHRKSNQFLV